ncbi:hypothetical protein ACQI4F_00605 [Mycolicibacterium vaccae]
MAEPSDGTQFTLLGAETVLDNPALTDADGYLYLRYVRGDERR